MLIAHKGKKHKVTEVTPNGVWYWIGRKPYFVTNTGLRTGEAYLIVELPNRDFLRDFVNMNNIKKTLVSKALGKSESWLTKMVNEKRYDMTDETLKSVMRILHIDWMSSEFLNVKATKETTSYRTRPSNYKTDMHKERLQRDFWNGLVVKA